MARRRLSSRPQSCKLPQGASKRKQRGNKLGRRPTPWTMDHGPWTSLMVLPRYTPTFINIHQTTLMHGPQC